MNNAPEVNKMALQSGALTIEQLNLMMRYLPVEVTFVDEKRCSAVLQRTAAGHVPAYARKSWAILW